MDLSFRSVKDSGEENVVYDIKLLKRLFSDDICSDILFGHAFSGCDTTSSIFGVGKKTVSNKSYLRILCYELLQGHSVLLTWILRR